MKRYIMMLAIVLLFVMGTEAVWADYEVESTEIESVETESTEVESTETESTETESTETERTEEESTETESEIPDTETEVPVPEEPEPEPVDELVIVIDPGHDSKHAGARGNGIVEENTVLKIGHYLKEELNKYQNVKVYMIREGKDCAFPDAKSAKYCNEARIAYAKSVQM